MQNMNIILGLHGSIGSGKSGAASFLVNKLNFKRYAFATPIKQACTTLFNFTNEQMEDRDLKESVDLRWGISPRDAFRLIGHGFRQSVCDDIWIKHMDSAIAKKRISDPTCSIVIDDVRYQNEIDFIEGYENGYVIRIIRPNGEGNDLATHASDTQQVAIKSGIVIENDHDIAALHAKMMFALNDIGYFVPHLFRHALAMANGKRQF